MRTEQKTPEIISRKSAAWEIIRLAIPMALSYTFSFGVVAMGMMMGRLKDQDETKDYLGANTLIIAMTQMVVIIGLGFALAGRVLASGQRGELTALQKELTELEELKEDSSSLAPSEKQPQLPSINASLNLKKEQIAKKITSISAIPKNGTLISAVPILLFVPALYFSKGLLEKIFDQKPDVSGLAQEYMRPYSAAFPGVMVRAWIEQILFSFEKTIPAMLIGLLTFGMGTALAAYLCFGPLKLGLAGIAWGYVVEAYLTCIGFGFYLGLHKSLNKFNFFTKLTCNNDDWQQIKTLFKIGLWIAVQFASELSAAYLFTTFAGWLGKDELSALDFSSIFNFFMLIPSYALGQATSQKVGDCMGEKKYENASRFATQGLVVSLGIVALFCIAVSAYPYMLTYMITKTVSDSVISMAKILVPLIATKVFFDTGSFNILQTLRNAKDVETPTHITLANLWLGFGLGALLAFKTNLGIYGLVGGYSLGIASGAMQVFYRFVKRIPPQALKTVDEAPEPPSCWAKLFTACKSCFRKSGEAEPLLPVNSGSSANVPAVAPPLA